jgi:hypothetical protein
MPPETPTTASEIITRVLQELTTHPLLLVQDKRLPSVITIATGQPLNTSWWSHHLAHPIFETLSTLQHHPDILFTRLIHAKVTLVHRRLWPAFLAVACSDEPWQRQGLSPHALSLLDQVTRSTEPAPCSGKPAKELTARLLIHTREIHTGSGRHILIAESWQTWAQRAGVSPCPDPEKARQTITLAAAALGAQPRALPW